jgi:hypothetical protein
MEAHMAKGRGGKRTITVITTTWTIRWWDGATWVEQTLGPSVEIVARGENTSSPNEVACDTMPAAQEPSRESETDQPTSTKEANP